MASVSFKSSEFDGTSELFKRKIENERKKNTKIRVKKEKKKKTKVYPLRVLDL